LNLAALIALASSGAASGADISPTADDRRAYALGQAYERSFEDYVEPGTCGIVLERQRCRDDFAAVKDYVGVRKMDDQVALWLKDGDIANRIEAWEGVSIPDQTWQDQPKFGWWYTAGVLSVADEMPTSTGVNDLLTSIVDTLTKHDDAAPSQFSGLVGATGAAHERVKPLIAALNEAVPPEAFPAVSLVEGDAGYAQLGVFYGCVGELMDNPMALSRPESRLFAINVADKLEAFDRQLGDTHSFEDLRNRLRADISPDNDVITTDLRQPLGDWAGILQKFPVQRDAFMFGTMTAQTAYNAAILKDKQADATYLRGFISNTKPYAGMSAEAKAAVHKMQDVPYGDWPNINDMATNATLAIIGQ
jgi:hypothetical protein